MNGRIIISLYSIVPNTNIRKPAASNPIAEPFVFSQSYKQFYKSL